MKKVASEGRVGEYWNLSEGEMVVVQDVAHGIPSVKNIGVVIGHDKTDDWADPRPIYGRYMVRTVEGDVSCSRYDLYSFMLACEPDEVPTEADGLVNLLKENAGEIISDLLRMAWRLGYFKKRC
jgi:hypothetical protein